MLALVRRHDASTPLRVNINPEGHRLPRGEWCLSFFAKDTMNNIPKALQASNLVCVMLDIHLWSGRQALKRDHLIASNPSLAALPPAELASMGSVRICDPEEVRAFQRIKNEAIRLLEENGLPFLGAYGIPADRFNGVYAKLVDIGNKFTARASDLLKRYDTDAAAWKAKWHKDNPAHAHLLTRMPDAQSVVGKLRFGFHPFAVQAPAADTTHAANDHFGAQLKGLKGELLSDAAVEANDLLTKYLVSKEGSHVGKRERITQKTLRPFKRISGKLRSFAFIDPSIAPLADVIDSVLRTLPAEGAVEGADLIAVWNLATMLSNPVQASRIAEISHAAGADSAMLALDSPMAIPQVVAQAQVAPDVEKPRTNVSADPLQGMDIEIPGVATTVVSGVMDVAPAVSIAAQAAEACSFL